MLLLLSELLVGAVESVTSQFGLSEFFIGIILIPIVGNVAEHLVAVQSAFRNKMELSMEISLSSSLQIALFVAPLLVFISLAMGHPLTLMFNPFELISLGAGVVIAALVSMDGESNWLEGASLLAVYLILGLAFLPVAFGRVMKQSSGVGFTSGMLVASIFFGLILWYPVPWFIVHISDRQPMPRRRLAVFTVIPAPDSNGNSADRSASNTHPVSRRTAFGKDRSWNNREDQWD